MRIAGRGNGNASRHPGRHGPWDHTAGRHDGPIDAWWIDAAGNRHTGDDRARNHDTGHDHPRHDHARNGGAWNDDTRHDFTWIRRR
jgi:hypothetical protein